MTSNLVDVVGSRAASTGPWALSEGTMRKNSPCAGRSVMAGEDADCDMIGTWLAMTSGAMFST